MVLRSARKSRRISAKRRKGFSWRKSRAARKIKQKIRFLFFAVLSLFLSTLLLVSFSVYKFAKAPLISASLGSVEKNSEWLGKDDINVLFFVVDDIEKQSPSLTSVYILKLVPQNLGSQSQGSRSHRYFILNLPVSAEIDLAERFGPGNLAKAFILGNLQEDRRGIKLIQETVFKQLALYSDSYVLVDSKGLSEFKEMFGEVDLKDFGGSIPATKIYLNPAFVRFLETRVKTNLSVPEIFRVLNFVRGVDTVNAKVFEIDEETFIDKELFDNFWKSYVVSSIVSEENSRVLVLNAAEVPGLALWGGRVVENSGMTLLGVGNTENKYEKSFLVVSDLESKTSQQLSRVFGIFTIKERDAVKSEDAMFLRGDIVVVLGLDIGSIL